MTTPSVATLGGLDLQAVTGQDESPRLVVPLWRAAAVLALPVVAPVLPARQSARVRRTDLTRLLRGGDVRGS